MPSTNLDNLVSLLKKLDGLFPDNVKKSLHGEVSESDKRLLLETFGWSDAPSELLYLLQWHDGQEWNSCLNPQNNRRLLSCSEIADDYAFLNNPLEDILQPWKATWVPILTHDSGDYLVFETAAEGYGQLIAYWHDNTSRQVEHDSLLEWARSLASYYGHNV